MQQKTPTHLLGRVDGFIGMIINISVPISQLLIGLVMGLRSQQLFILFLGVIIVAKISINTQ